MSKALSTKKSTSRPNASKVIRAPRPHATLTAREPQSAVATVTSQPKPVLKASDAALAYKSTGWSPIPVPAGQKGPTTPGWQKLQLTPEQIPQAFADDPNVGLLLGAPSGGLVDVDLDTPEARKVVSAFLPPTARVHGRKGNPKSHWWYLAPDLKTKQFRDPVDGAMLCEVRSTGAQTIVPPSTHPSGEQLEWVLDGDAPPINPDFLLRAVARLAAAATLARHWPASGSREQAALALSGALLRNEWSEPETRIFVRAVALAAGDEEVEKRESTVADTKARLDAGKPTTGVPALANLVGDEVVKGVIDWLGLNVGAEGEKAEGDDKKSEGTTIPAKLIDIATTESDLYADDRGEAIAHYAVNGHRELRPVASKSFRQWLTLRYHDKHKGFASSETLATAINILEAKAHYELKRTKLRLRSARTEDGAIWIDMTDKDWRAIRVTADGWAVVNNPPPLFRRYSHQAPMPEPQQGGDAKMLFDFLNVTKDDEVLFLSSLVAAFIPDVPQAIIILHGPQGSAKTTAAKMRRALIDPSEIPTINIRGDLGEWTQALDHHFVPILDNLTSLAEWQSNLLCQAATGGGFTKRGLYTDSDDVILSFLSRVVLTGINLPSAQPDLLDRSLLIGLERVPPEKRREESQLWADYGAAYPKMFGGVLDALSKAMKVYPSINLGRLPRLADFARWSAAAAEALGYGSEAFLTAMFKNAERQVEEIVESDPVAEAVRDFARKEGDWNGTPQALWEKLSTGPRVEEKGWPKRAADMGRRLNILRSPLNDLGIEVTPSRSKDADRKRMWSIAVRKKE
jgi:hypothetical protein